MGSDLNYADMTSRNLEEYDFAFWAKQREMEIDGHRAWIIASTPRGRDVVEKTGYQRSLLFVRPDIDMVVRSVSWENRGGYVKYMEVKRIDVVDGIRVATEIHVKRNRGKQTVHRTVLKLTNVSFGNPLTLDFFTVRQLEKGP